jgi:GNAT superfamily N-acetyltransferase
MDMEFRISKTADADLISLEEEVSWGTHGTLYKLHNVEHDLELLPNPTFLSLYDNGKLCAVFMQAARTVGVNSQMTCSARYQCLLAVRPGNSGKGFGKHILGEAKRFSLDDLGKSGLIYVYIEDGNERSHRIFNSLGYKRIGGYESCAFSRIHPRDDHRAVLADKNERIIITSLLKDLYADHILTEFDNSVHSSDYFIFKENGKIIAGLQTVPQHWTLVSLPGISGAFFVNIMPRIPFFKTLLDPPGFHCLRISNVYVREDRESVFFTLLSAVLSRHNLHNAVVQWDPSSPVAKRVSAAGSYGLFGSMSVTSASVMACFKNLSQNTIDEICSRPLCISPLDP